MLKAGSGSVFSPKRGEQDRSRVRRSQRKSKVPPSQVVRGEAAKRCKRAKPPGETYTVAAYRKAIHRACDMAGVERWSPNRLRHNAAERFRRKFGVEVARCVLGHSDIRTTQLYSEMDQAKAVAAAREIG
jgi:integrase